MASNKRTYNIIVWLLFLPGKGTIFANVITRHVMITAILQYHHIKIAMILLSSYHNIKRSTPVRYCAFLFNMSFKHCAFLHTIFYFFFILPISTQYRGPYGVVSFILR